MKILIIPDVHGRDFWIEPCSHIDDYDKVIFLGDYHDPYQYQVSKKLSRHRLRDSLVPFVLEHKDKVICLLGNHDASYTKGLIRVRFDGYHRNEIRELLNQMDLKLAHKEGNYLFTHSGVLPYWLNTNNLTLDDVLSGQVNRDELEQISYYRDPDSYDEVGSCIWGDVREYDKADKLPNLYQIFGHTQLKSEIIKDNYACLDCRKAFVLDTELQTLKPYNYVKG